MPLFGSADDADRGWLHAGRNSLAADLATIPPGFHQLGALSTRNTEHYITPVLTSASFGRAALSSRQEYAELCIMCKLPDLPRLSDLCTLRVQLAILRHNRLDVRWRVGAVTRISHTTRNIVEEKKIVGDPDFKQWVQESSLTH